MSAFALVVSGWLVFASVASPPPEASSRLPVRRVVLYGNGVAFVERRGRVAGRAELRLSVKPSQLDDVLKSLVVLDLGRGRIRAVGYDTPTPAEAGLGEVGFRLEPSTSGDCGTGGLAAVLHQLQGAAVAVATADGLVAGRILTVEHRRTEGKDGTGVASAFLVLAGETRWRPSFTVSRASGSREDVDRVSSLRCPKRWNPRSWLRAPAPRVPEPTSSVRSPPHRAAGALEAHPVRGARLATHPQVRYLDPVVANHVAGKTLNELAHRMAHRECCSGDPTPQVASPTFDSSITFH